MARSAASAVLGDHGCGGCAHRRACGVCRGLQIDGSATRRRRRVGGCIALRNDLLCGCCLVLSAFISAHESPATHHLYLSTIDRSRGSRWRADRAFFRRSSAYLAIVLNDNVAGSTGASRMHAWSAPATADYDRRRRVTAKSSVSRPTDLIVSIHERSIITGGHLSHQLIGTSGVMFPIASTKLIASTRCDVRHDASAAHRHGSCRPASRCVERSGRAAHLAVAQPRPSRSVVPRGVRRHQSATA